MDDAEHDEVDIWNAESGEMTEADKAEYAERKRIRDARDEALRVEPIITPRKPHPPRKIRIEMDAPATVSAVGARHRKTNRANYNPLTTLNEKIVKASVVLPIGTSLAQIAEMVGCTVGAVEDTFKKRDANRLRVQLMVQITGHDALQVEARMVKAGLDDALREETGIPWREIRAASTQAAARAGHDAMKVYIDGNEEDLQALGM